MGASWLQPKHQTNEDAIQREPDKQQMNEEDKAVLNLKKTNRMLSKQISELEKQTQEFWNKAKEEKKEKNDDKALSLMRRRKLYQKYLDAARGKQVMIEETLHQIKSAKTDVNVMKALEQGQEVIEDLRSKASVEDFERIMEQQQETQDQEEELRQMLKQNGIEDDEVMDDVDQLEAELFGKELDKVEVPKDVINKNVENDDEEEQEVEGQEKVTKKRKKVAA